MADLSKKEVALEWQEQSSGLLDKGRITLAAAVLAVGLSTSVQASDLLKQCDFNKNWAIDTPATYWVSKKDLKPEQRDLIQKENNCKVQFYLAKRKEDLAKGKEDLAKGKEDLAKETGDYNKMIQILAMLDPKEARKYLNYEIKKIEIQLKTEKNDTTRKSLLYRLDILKSRLSELDKKVA